MPADVAGLGAALSMVDACQDLSQSNSGGRVANPLAQINRLSLKSQGLKPHTWKRPTSSAVENLWPYNPTNSSDTYFPIHYHTPSNNGLAKVDYHPTKNTISMRSYMISRETTARAVLINPLEHHGVGSTAEYAGAWT